LGSNDRMPVVAAWTNTGTSGNQLEDVLRVVLVGIGILAVATSALVTSLGRRTPVRDIASDRPG
jgi:hypothetical protein